jgi:DNA-binding response OmpR family regulator
MARILIAEDDREIAMLEKDYMEINGFEAVIAEDGIKAMELLEKEAFDLIVLDIMMPGKNGYDI